MMIVYGLKNCDTCRNAIRWLDAEGIAYEYRDVRKDRLDADDVRRWLNAVGSDVLLNRRGTTWRNLDDADKEYGSDDNLVALLVKHPALIKRPVFINDADVIVGFKAEQKAALTD